MAMTWTKEQQQVIDLRKKNILVSAAAGSGKTAVLVERIITRLTKDQPPLDVDRLLIVTYTDAAAAEMRDRIGAAIEQALEKEPENVHLKKQSALIHTAKITTIHSFCLSVMKEYFHTIDLDPGFRVGEEGELKLLRQDVMREMLEARYASGDENFLRFVETFATGREDTKLEEMIGRLYEYAGSYPEPEKWLEECAAAYEQGLSGDSPYVQSILAYIQNCLADVGDMMEEARAICLEPDGPYMYEKTIEEDKEILAPLLEFCRGLKGEDGAVRRDVGNDCTDPATDAGEVRDLAGGAEKKAHLPEENPYIRLYDIFKIISSWPRLASNRDKSVDAGKAAQVKALRESWKKLIDGIGDAYFFQEPPEMEADLELCRPVMRMLVELVEEFQQAFADKKAEKNLIDFRDMEQFALKILTREEDGRLVPSETAKEYQEQFEEVMIDEYQDSNLIQEAILTSVSRAERGEYNLFMVGDVKQSIYRFRLSRPELFMEKFDRYSTTDGNLRRIDLHKNFRSRREVLDAANAVFEQIMTRKLGKIEYDENAALYVGADYPETPGCETEILVVDTQVDEEGVGKDVKETVRELEARAAAERIHELMKTKQVWDGNKGEFRPVRYSDIVILTRSLAGWTDVFTRILGREGIPAFAGSREGYFGTLEIGWILDYLRVLDNYRQDIPLAAVLKSPFGGCTNEELAQIRDAYPEGPFYEAVLRAAQEESAPVPEAVTQKIQSIFRKLTGFREKVSYTSIHDLLWEIMDETGYRSYISAMPGGEQRLANLDMLLTRAKSYEATSYKGLFHFVRYIEQLKKYDVDFGEAGIYDEQTNAVRLMSIHKSKGLEFPVVIVAGMGKQFNTQDIRASVVIHPELGLGIDAVDIERRTKSPTLIKKAIQMETELEDLGEELRILYVAMTRAKEKLILLGTLKGAEEKLEGYERNKKLTFSRLAGAHTYFDWVLPAWQNLPPNVPIKFRLMKLEDLVVSESEREMEELLEKKTFLRAVEEGEDLLSLRDDWFAQRLREQFSYRYPYEGEEQYKLKYTVSELKKRAALPDEENQAGQMLVEEEEVIPLIPKFLQEEEPLTGASRGSAYHKLLELLDFAKEYDAEGLKEEMATLRRERFLGEDMAECIRVQDILHFLQTSSGQRMHRAACGRKLYKEQPFVFGVDAKEFYLGADTRELVLIQGIIDVYFEEDDALVVLDYKTDRVQKAQELVDKYQEQLHLYGRALEQMTGKRVKEKIIYSFTLAEEISL
ncbi:helicase-exonuclease AddAB subunit AddA [Roseburia hominis]